MILHRKQISTPIDKPKRLINIYTATRVSEDQLQHIKNDTEKHANINDPPSQQFKTDIIQKHYKILDRWNDLNLIRIHCQYCNHQILITTNPTHPPQLKHCVNHLKRHYLDTQ